MNEQQLIDALRENYRAECDAEQTAERCDAEYDRAEKASSAAHALVVAIRDTRRDLSRRLLVVIRTGSDPGPKEAK